MALTKVYDLEGREHEKETVDARECVAEMGWSFDPPVNNDNQGGPTREAMKTFLSVNGVSFAKNISDEKLSELYAETIAKIEA